jgi:hypothetical protein
VKIWSIKTTEEGNYNVELGNVRILDVYSVLWLSRPLPASLSFPTKPITCSKRKGFAGPAEATLQSCDPICCHGLGGRSKEICQLSCIRTFTHLFAAHRLSRCCNLQVADSCLIEHRLPDFRPDSLSDLQWSAESPLSAKDGSPTLRETVHARRKL